MKSFFKLLCLAIVGVQYMEHPAMAVIEPVSTANAQEFAKGTIIVKFVPEVKFQESRDAKSCVSITTGIQTIDKLNEKYAVKIADALFPSYKPRKQEVIIQGKTVKVPGLANIYKLTLDEHSDVLQAVQDYKNIPDVVYAEPDYIAYACSTPDDPYFNEQWGLKKIQAEAAWDTTTGDSSVIIGILDTGIDIYHEDIQGNIWLNKAEILGDTIDNDGNTFIDDMMGWNFVSNDNDITDGAGHGTHCAGVSGAVTNNNTGVAGVSWKSKLMAVKVLNNNGRGKYSDIEKGIIYAAQNGAKVINMSLGGDVYSSSWEDVLINAYAGGTVLVAAAGNDNKDALFYPACFPMVLGVSATDSNDIKWDGANYGSWVDISAPGVAIYNTRLNDYARFTGTSCAAPFVSGVAALVASYKPEFSSGAIMSMIVNNTEPIDSLNPAYAGKLGSGRLNAELALTGNTLPKFIVFGDTIKDKTGDNDGVPDVGETVNLILVLQNNGMDATGVSATLDVDDIDITILDSTANFGNTLARETAHNSADVFTFSVSATCPQHNVLFKLYLTANAGAYKDTVEFSIRTSNTRDVSGPIHTDTTWRKGTYIVRGNVMVDSGVTLTIEPGAEIRIDSAKSIVIQGTLNAIGTEQDSIIFTRNSPDTNKRWDRLWFKPGSSKGNFQYCRIEWAGHSGIYFESSDSLSVANSTISDNSGSSGGGGGIHNYSGVLTISNSTISNSGGDAIEGGGIRNNSGSGTITNSTISNNYSSMIGGGIHNNSGSLTIINSTISNNSAGSGGGICNASGLLTIANSIISYNSGNNYGGGIYNISGSFTITNSAISNNSAGNYGGGISNNSNGLLTITNNTISNNSAGRYGGSMYLEYCDTLANEIINNTIVDNSSCTIYGFVNEMHFNNLIVSQCAIHNTSVNDIPADSNWWGTTKTAKIDSLIYDYNDGDFNLGVVDYTPFLTSPSRSAPPYLDSIQVNPNPVSIEMMYVYLTFSKPMDTTIAPKVLFGMIVPTIDTLKKDSVVVDTSYNIDTLNAYKFDGVWADSMHWNGYYLINEMVLDSVYRIRVSDARDDSFPFPIPTDTRGTFRVYTAVSASRELIAESGSDAVTLHWHPSSISNLQGYNIHRGTTSGGPYELLNPKVITDTTYADSSRGVEYYYVYTILDNNFHESSYSSEATGYIGTEEIPIPKVFALLSPNPNPFTQSTTIHYQLPVKSSVSLRLYDICGRQVRTLVNGTQKAGYWTVNWDGKDNQGKKLATGIYFCKFETDARGATPNFKANKKLLLLK